MPPPLPLAPVGGITSGLARLGKGPSRAQAQAPLILGYRVQGKRRVQQETAQRRHEGAHGRVEPSQEDAARRVSESVVSDDSLVPGDIIVTDKGMFVFRGRDKDGDCARDFDPVEGPAGLKAK